MNMIEGVAIATMLTMIVLLGMWLYFSFDE